jgi:uncharacterized protein
MNALPEDGPLPRLCIFARVPRLGYVKTRLAAELGAPAALTAHITLVEDTLHRVGTVPGVVTELWLDGEPDPTCRCWAEEYGVAVRRQGDGDLGARMHEALCAGLSRSPFALVVGTDCPLIDDRYVAAAVAALVDCEVVLGPAADGGYGLVGVRRPAPELFRDVPWGTADVLRSTLTAARAAGLTVSLLPEIWDVDTAEDWQRYRRLRGAG